MANDDTLMFVYGTLGRGPTNHTRYLSLVEQRGGATLVAEATTIEQFPMVIRPKHMLPRCL